jgi:peptide/nickel transport system permease protein
MAEMASAPRAKPARIGFGRSLLWWLGNWKLSLGLFLLLFLLLFALIGSWFVSYEKTDVGWGPINEKPSSDYPFGTDNVGRDIFALIIYGIPTSLKIGLIAAGVGTSVGAILGSVVGYHGGWIDTVLRTISDIMLTIPSLLVLAIIASYIRASTIDTTAFVIALFAWAGPTRTIRSQVLTMRERGFVSMARLMGRGDLEILMLEILPNILPYIAAGFVGGVTGAIMASVGIQLLGLGPLDVPNLGMVLQFAFEGAALYKGAWWWWGAPAAMLFILFMGLFLVSLALDEVANPRLRQRAG